MTPSSNTAMPPASLKIGLVLDTSLDPTDGVQQYVISVGEWLRSQGHDVHYLVGETHDRNLPNVHSLARNVAVTFNGNRTTIPLPTSRRKLRNFLGRQKFDVLHVQVPHSPFMAQRLIMAVDPGTAVVGTFHILPYGLLARAGNKGLGIWLRPSLKRFDKMLAVSSAAADFARSSFGMEATVLPNVIDFQMFNIASPLDTYNDDKLNILFLGRLVPRKGCQLLLQAVAELTKRKDIPEFRVIICGHGPLDSKLKAYVRDHHLDQIVEFTGFVSEEDKPRYYASADIAVFPSSGGESFGIVLLEAMANGRSAVLAGDNPGYRSVMSPQPELLVDPKNAAGLADKIGAYLSDQAARQKMANWGETYTREFDVKVVGQKLLAVYNEALRKRRQL